MPEAVFDTRACARRIEETDVAEVLAEAHAGALRAAVEATLARADGGVGCRFVGGAVLAAALLAAGDGGASGQAEGDPWHEAREEVDVVHCRHDPSGYP